MRTSSPDGGGGLSDHGAELSEALDDFHEQLTRRWRDLAVNSIISRSGVSGSDDVGPPPDFPFHLTRQDVTSASDRGREIPWRFWEGSAAEHVYGEVKCDYLVWVLEGQQRPFTDIRCDGMTDPADYSGNKIECRMGDVMREIEYWAWDERIDLFDRLSLFPLYGEHSESVLKAAHEKFLRLGGILGLEEESERNTEVPMLPPEQAEFLAEDLELSSGGDVRSQIERLGLERGQWKNWWEDWTGRAAEAAESGFFTSVTPTTNNHAALLGFLANAYAVRAAMAEEAQRRSIDLVEGTTAALRKTEKKEIDHTVMWNTLDGLSKILAVAVTVGTGGTGAALLGASMGLVAFAGKNLLGKSEVVVYKNADLITVMDTFRTKINELHRKVDSLEQLYLEEVRDAREAIQGEHSFDLELYDVTANDPAGRRSGAADNSTPEKGGRDPDVIRGAAEPCDGLASLYRDRIIPEMDDTEDAGSWLADKDGLQSDTDRAVLELRETLKSFFSTTAARYTYAAELIRETAEAYERTDAEVLEEIENLDRETLQEAESTERNEELAPEGRVNQGMDGDPVYVTEEMLARDAAARKGMESIENVLNDVSEDRSQ